MLGGGYSLAVFVYEFIWGRLGDFCAKSHFVVLCGLRLVVDLCLACFFNWEGLVPKKLLRAVIFESVLTPLSWCG